jgi:flavin-dependent dehydrogenase
MLFDAAVIGSGPAGATTAQLLARAGWSVALIERNGFPRRKVCGEFISAATLPILAACGVRDEFLTCAGPAVQRIAGFSGNTLVEAPVTDARTGWGRALGREHLDVLLRDSALRAGATVIQPAEAIALRTREDGHQLTVQHADTVDEIGARIVIVACGSWNTKGPFAISARSHAADLFAFKANFHGGQLAADLMPLLAFPGGYGGMVHRDGGLITLTCCIRRDALMQARDLYGGKAGEAVLHHILASTEGVRHALSRATVQDAILATGPLRPGIRARYRAGVFFVGNIAGEAHPIIAEGISMALQSAWLLAQGLISGRPVAGQRYARDWIRQFAPRLHAASVFAWLAMNDRSRTTAARLIRAYPSILTVGARLSGKTDLRRDAA